MEQILACVSIGMARRVRGETLSREWKGEPVAGGFEKKSPARYPQDGLVLSQVGYYDGIFGRVDEMLSEDKLRDGRLDFVTDRARLTVLIHSGATHSAGICEDGVYAPVPLREVAARARQMHGAMCSVAKCDAAVVLMMAVEFRKRPEIQGSTRYIDPGYVLRVLERDQVDAAVSCERDGARTFLFVQAGRPVRMYFADPEQDPGGEDLEDRLIRFAFTGSAKPTHVEVYRELRVDNDPERGSPLVRLLLAAAPCPPMAVTASLSDGRVVAERAFQPPELIIGRDPSVGVVLDNLAVSRRHARLSWEWGTLHIEDLGSQNGTLVNGEPIERVEISVDDEVTIGKFVVRVEESGIGFGSETMLVPLSEMTSVTPLGIFGKSGDFEVDQDLLFGRSDGVDVRVKGLFVAPVHARLSPKRDGSLELVCFGKGTARVNGERVRTARLSSGDHLKVGRTLFEVRELESSSAP